jgi:ATP-dependent Clp protease ATP-binding subunit ClpC
VNGVVETCQVWKPKGYFPMMRFDRFTERAQEAAQRAAEIIQRYGHNQIDTEHILLALIEQPGGVIPQILEKLSVSLKH